MSLPLQVIDPRPTRSVPCGTCNECCRGDAIFIHPECGDDASLYKTEMYEGRLILQHQPNGDCIYLDRARGCSIWSLRPTICRELDCRLLVEAAGEKRLNAMGMNRLVAAARRLRKNGIGSSPAPRQPAGADAAEVPCPSVPTEPKGDR